MHLNLHTDFGLRVLLYLGSTPDGMASAPDVAAAYDISLNHLRKVVQALSHAGYVQTTRGRTGGIALARPPEEIVIGQVVRALEPDFRLVECFEPATNRCVVTPGCALMHALDDAQKAFLAVLDGYTLADVVRNKAFLWRLLRRPEAAQPGAGH